MTQMPNHFTIEASLGDATIKAAVRSDRVDETIAGWQEFMAGLGSGTNRADVRQFVTDALMEEKHNDPELGQTIIAALIWLAADGERGEQLLPMMRQGGGAIGFDIIRVGPTTFNFRLSVDDETGRAIS